MKFIHRLTEIWGERERKSCVITDIGSSDFCVTREAGIQPRRGRKSSGRKRVGSCWCARNDRQFRGPERRVCTKRERYREIAGKTARCRVARYLGGEQWNGIGRFETSGGHVFRFPPRGLLLCGGPAAAAVAAAATAASPVSPVSEESCRVYREHRA